MKMICWSKKIYQGKQCNAEGSVFSIVHCLTLGLLVLAMWNVAIVTPGITCYFIVNDDCDLTIIVYKRNHKRNILSPEVTQYSVSYDDVYVMHHA